MSESARATTGFTSYEEVSAHSSKSTPAKFPLYGRRPDFDFGIPSGLIYAAVSKFQSFPDFKAAGSIIVILGDHLLNLRAGLPKCVHSARPETDRKRAIRRRSLNNEVKVEPKMLH